MTPEEITITLKELFNSQAVQQVESGTWQVETPQLRVLILLSSDQSWLRLLVPIASAQDAQPFLEQLLEANFDETQETRYALNQNVLWGVFQHKLETLDPADFGAAILRLVALCQQGLDSSFDQLVDRQIRQIIRAAKQQGQSLETTLQTLDRFYREGLMGEMEAREQTEVVLAQWQQRLERLWSEVEP